MGSQSQVSQDDLGFRILLLFKSFTDKNDLLQTNLLVFLGNLRININGCARAHEPLRGRRLRIGDVIRRGRTCVSQERERSRAAIGRQIPRRGGV